MFLHYSSSAPAERGPGATAEKIPPRELGCLGREDFLKEGPLHLLYFREQMRCSKG